MALCCFYICWKKKKCEGNNCTPAVDLIVDNKALLAELEHIPESSGTNELRPTSFSVPIPFPLAGGGGRGSRCNVKKTDHSNAGDDVDYEEGDEHDESLSTKKDNYYMDLQGIANTREEQCRSLNHICSDHCVDMDIGNNGSGKMSNNNNNYVDDDDDDNICGHISDPGIHNKTEALASPRLKRSCSDLVMRSMSRELAKQLPYSDEEELRQCAKERDKVLDVDAMSPVSATTHLSADKVMLKKHSSSQILPSKSRKLWWKLFLWSHRNLRRAETAKQHLDLVYPGLNKQGGYCSDTAEESGRAMDSSSKSKLSDYKELRDGDGVYAYGSCGTWPQNQWVAFPAESSSSSPLARVDKWVMEAATATSGRPSSGVVNDDHDEDCVIFPPSSDQNVSTSATGSSYHLTGRHFTVAEEVSHANSVIQSLNGSSTVAHIAGIGLKVIPFMSHLSSLRSLNVSGNFIAHVTPGSLPKGLHVLNLSRNKITTIEGLKELTRLRVLDLSYNRISQIGQGLSNCTLIKELYLSGNKISVVEALHRLLKLTVLDLSFNKITTKKGLGQLVANYNSLIALNLLGNPIQGNVSEDQLRKTICSLLPKLAFLNRQPVNPQRARESGMDAIAKAAVGSRVSSTRRKILRRTAAAAAAQGSSSSRRISSVGASQKSRQRSKTHSSRHSVAKDKTR